GAALGACLVGRPVLASRIGRGIAGWLGLGALVALAGLYGTATLGHGWVFRGGLQLVALLAAAVILGALQPGSPVQRLLSLEPLRRLGLVSYAVYLFHWP